MIWKDSVVLVTGGTGSFGKKFAEVLLEKFHPRKLIIFSRDELKQYDMQRQWNGPEVRYFIGDVRDRDRLTRALEGVDTVVHAAALKQVPAAEYNPFECIKTNVLGAENLIEACLGTGVQRVVALSTDKAAAPINLYGATKLCSDKLFIAANNIRGPHHIRFSVVRYGNVMGSRGSVIPFFLEKRHTGTLPITDPRMTRFNITLDEGVNMVLHALEHSEGGEIFVPKIPSYRILDVAEAIGPDCAKPVMGIRAGEKIHEEMVTEFDAPQTIVTDKHYIIVPMRPGKKQDDLVAEFCKLHDGEPVSEGFSYHSGRNTEWLTVEQIRELIQQHVDPSFAVSGR
jgi:UDP-N-acetylglucosamine 4,6-dehydratase